MYYEADGSDGYGNSYDKGYLEGWQDVNLEGDSAQEVDLEAPDTAEGDAKTQAILAAEKASGGSYDSMAMKAAGAKYDTMLAAKKAKRKKYVMIGAGVLAVGVAVVLISRRR